MAADGVCHLEEHMLRAGEEDFELRPAESVINSLPGLAEGEWCSDDALCIGCSEVANMLPQGEHYGTGGLFVFDTATIGSMVLNHPEAYCLAPDLLTCCSGAKSPAASMAEDSHWKAGHALILEAAWR